MQDPRAISIYKAGYVFYEIGKPLEIPPVEYQESIFGFVWDKRIEEFFLLGWNDAQEYYDGRIV